MPVSNQVEVVMQMDRTLRTTKGHVLRFKAREPRMIPRNLLNEAMQHGAVPVTVEDTKDEEPKPPEGPSTMQERRELIRNAIFKMEERKAREDFTASGAPTLEVLKSETQLSDLDSRERDSVYDEIKAERSGET